MQLALDVGEAVRREDCPRWCTGHRIPIATHFSEATVVPAPRGSLEVYLALPVKSPDRALLAISTRRSSHVSAVFVEAFEASAMISVFLALARPDVARAISEQLRLLEESDGRDDP